MTTPGYPAHNAELKPENRTVIKDDPKGNCPRCGCPGKGTCPRCERDVGIIQGSLKKYPPRRF